jgi:hypothetical protein
MGINLSNGIQNNQAHTLQYYNNITKATGDFDHAVHKKTQDFSPKKSCAIYGSGERGIAKLKANSPGPACFFVTFGNELPRGKPRGINQ